MYLRIKIACLLAMLLTGCLSSEKAPIAEVTIPVYDGCIETVEKVSGISRLNVHMERLDLVSQANNKLKWIARIELTNNEGLMVDGAAYLKGLISGISKECMPESVKQTIPLSQDINGSSANIFPVVESNLLKLYYNNGKYKIPDSWMR